MKASPSFTHLVRDAAKLVPYPTIAGSTLWDARKDRGKLCGNLSDEAIAQINAGMDGDYTVFLQRIGVRSSENPLGI